MIRCKVSVFFLLFFLVFLLIPPGSPALAAANSSQGKALVLMYHHFAPPGLNVTYNRIIIDPLEFETQMKYLRDNKYNVIFLRELEEAMEKNAPLPSKTVVVTFDDGYESNYVYAYPILKKYNIKATINLVVGWVTDFNPLFQPEVLSMMTWDEIREMQVSGLVDFQSHTYNLHRYGNLDLKGYRTGPMLTNPVYNQVTGHQETKEEYQYRVYQDLTKAKIILEEKINNPVSILTYPYGSYNKEVQELACKAGYKMFVTINNGINRPGEPLTEIKRVNVGRGDDFPDLLQKWLAPGEKSCVRKNLGVTESLMLRDLEKWQ